VQPELRQGEKVVDALDPSARVDTANPLEQVDNPSQHAGKLGPRDRVPVEDTHQDARRALVELIEQRSASSNESCHPITGKASCTDLVLVTGIPIDARIEALKDDRSAVGILHELVAYDLAAKEQLPPTILFLSILRLVDVLTRLYRSCMGIASIGLCSLGLITDRLTRPRHRGIISSDS
jgi:hypothetical protein